MKIEAELLELAALHGELGKIALAIAIVILLCMVTAAIQDRRRDR
jgi:hypothetical protein